MHIPRPKIPLHKDFVANDLPKWNICSSPHPPHIFGMDKSYHLARWRDSFSLLPTNKKWKDFLLIRSKIKFGFLERDSKYIGIFSNTDFTNIKWPPMDNHLLCHWLILVSTFITNYIQSSLWWLNIWVLRNNADI